MPQKLSGMCMRQSFEGKANNQETNITKRKRTWRKFKIKKRKAESIWKEVKVMATNNLRLSNGRYVYDTTARNIDVKKAIEERPSFSPLKVYEGQNLQEKKNMSFFYVLFFFIHIHVHLYSI